MSTYVLVHGAWGGSWCWKRVRKALQALRLGSLLHCRLEFGSTILTPCFEVERARRYGETLFEASREIG